MENKLTNWGDDRYYFFFSKKQYSKVTGMFSRYPTFKGKTYTEMREVGMGWASHEDSVFLGVGTMRDVSRGLIKCPSSIDKQGNFSPGKYTVRCDPYKESKVNHTEVRFKSLQDGHRFYALETGEEVYATVYSRYITKISDLNASEQKDLLKQYDVQRKAIQSVKINSPFKDIL